MSAEDQSRGTGRKRVTAHEDDGPRESVNAGRIRLAFSRLGSLEPREGAGLRARFPLAPPALVRPRGA